MKYMRLTEGQKGQHPSIHYTGSVRGMKKLGYWGKNDVCVRCGASTTSPDTSAHTPQGAGAEKGDNL